MSKPLTLENAPRLKIDETLYGKEGRPSPQGVLERRIVWNLMKYLGASGFHPFEVSDGETVTRTDGETAATMELVFNLDEAWVFFRDGVREVFHAVKLVMGNGVDIVSDYNYTPGDPDNFAALMDSFDAEAFA